MGQTRRDRKSNLELDDGIELTESLRSPSLRLLAAILKTASNDLECVKGAQAKGDLFCDRTHLILCRDYYFDTGYQELREFFHSQWFDRICDEFGFQPEDIRRILEID